ncbi:MAG: hypothetical protein AAGD22_08350 [Verrucomicrobiota bacterium]
MAKTICDWKKADISRNPEKLERLIANPCYLCVKCGRAANTKKVLCRAKPAFRRYDVVAA